MRPPKRSCKGSACDSPSDSTPARGTYAQRAARNVEVGDVVRFGGVHWMTVNAISESIPAERITFYDAGDGKHERLIRRQADDIMHVLDV